MRCSHRHRHRFSIAARFWGERDLKVKVRERWTLKLKREIESIRVSNKASEARARSPLSSSSQRRRFPRSSPLALDVCPLFVVLPPWYVDLNCSLFPPFCWSCSNFTCGIVVVVLAAFFCLVQFALFVRFRGLRSFVGLLFSVVL